MSASGCERVNDITFKCFTSVDMILLLGASNRENTKDIVY